MRKRTKRKVVWPKLSGLHVVAERSRKPNADISQGLMLQAYLALEALRGGLMKRGDWDDLIRALNIAHLLATGPQGIGAEFLPDILAARQALLEIGVRGLHDDDKFVAHDAELQKIGRLLEIHEAQMSLATAGEMSDAACRERELLRSGARVSPQNYVPTQQEKSDC